MLVERVPYQPWERVSQCVACPGRSGTTGPARFTDTSTSEASLTALPHSFSFLSYTSRGKLGNCTEADPLRTVLLNSIIHIVAASIIGVSVGLCCAWHSEVRAIERQKLEGKRIETRSEEPPDREPWLQVEIVDKSPPTRLHLCLFFGAWGGLIGALLAAGGQWPATLKWGVFGGVFWLIHRAGGCRADSQSWV